MAQLENLAGKFHTLHASGCFVIPNPWDVGTAIYLERLGFKALATTSAGFAFSSGKPDGGVPRDEMLAHIREIVDATSLPVNAEPATRMNQKKSQETSNSASRPVLRASPSKTIPDTTINRYTKRSSRSSAFARHAVRLIPRKLACC
jgi:hypothetical protein